MFSKRIVILGVIILVVVILIGVAVYYSEPNKAPAMGENGYKNDTYGFYIDFPDSWKGFTVKEDIAKAWGTGDDPELEGDFEIARFTFRNPNWTTRKNWQDIPVLVVPQEIWKLIVEEKMRVSAAPISPEKVAENNIYVFALPPRWTFEQGEGWQEAERIAKTLGAFKVNLEE